jgi:predicted nucleic acid-binding protein
MNKVLIDTDILINFLRGKKKEKDFLFSLSEDATIYCSAITVAEIYAGMKEHERALTINLIDGLNIVDVTRDIAEKAGDYKSKIKTHALELDDCLIAASAFMKQALLATGNAKHYPMKDIEKIVVK